jgi:pimeloyl-ACP methyl ester carboxylesterase
VATDVQVQNSEPRFVDLGGPVHYRDWPGPDGRSFVLVHGLGGSHVNWTQVAPGLSRSGRVLALDLAGFGLTPRAGRGSTLTANRRLLSEFVRAQASGPIVLCGNSMGGVVAMMQAAFEPGSVAGLVLTDSAFPWARGGVPAPAVIGGFALYRTPGLGRWVVRQRFTRMTPERLVEIGLRLTAADPSSIPGDVAKALVDVVRDRQRDPDAAPAFLDAAVSLLRLGARPELCRRVMDAIRCPVLVLHGARDRFVPVQFARAAAQHRPSWQLRVFPDLGHIPQMEAPGRWLAAVEEWMDELPTAPDIAGTT